MESDIVLLRQQTDSKDFQDVGVKGKELGNYPGHKSGYKNLSRSIFKKVANYRFLHDDI